MSWRGPLFGLHPKLTALGALYCGLFVVFVFVSALFSWEFIEFVPEDLGRVIDGLPATVIFAAGLSATVLPLVYSIINGGPAMALLIGMTPSLSALFVSRHVVLTNDLVLALLASAIGVSIGVVRVAMALGDSHGPTLVEETVDGLLLATVVTVIATMAVLRFQQGAPSAMVESIMPWAWLVAVPIALVSGFWLVWGRRLLAEGYPETTDTSQ